MSKDVVWLSTAEVAKRLGVTRRRVLQMINGIRNKDGSWRQEAFLPARLRGNGHFYVREEDLPLAVDRPSVGWKKGRKRKKAIREWLKDDKYCHYRHIKWDNLKEQVSERQFQERLTKDTSPQ